MNTKKMSIFCMIILTLLIASSASRAFAQEPFVIGFVPSSNSIDPTEDFTVNVTVTNMPSPGLFSYEYRVYYDTNVLNATAADIPTDHFLKPTVKASNIIVVDSGTINETEGWVSFAASLMYPEEGKTGAGTLATITFKALAPGNSTLMIKGLTLPDPIFLDPNAVSYLSSAYTLQSTTIPVIPEFIVPILMGVFAVLSTAAVVLRKKLK